MDMDAVIKRINELAAKNKAEGLTEEELVERDKLRRAALEALDEEDGYGMILRAKGILPLNDGRWLHFDYVPGEADIRYGSADYTGRLCVIGTGINESALKNLFGL